jgi:prophage antirepressor-like protein
MTELLQHPKFGNVRIVINNGETFFVGKDLCEAFGDRHYLRSMGKLDEDEKGMTHIATPGGKQEMIVVNESGLYHLLFMFEPQKGTNRAIADERILFLKTFRKWVTSEVLPSIRKFGFYSTNQRKMDNAVKRAEVKAKRELFKEINGRLSTTDKKLIAKQCLTTEYEVNRVLKVEKEDVYMATLLFNKAIGNKELYSEFYTMKGAEDMLKILIQNNR